MTKNEFSPTGGLDKSIGALFSIAAGALFPIAALPRSSYQKIKDPALERRQMSNLPLDTDKVRALFPAFSTPELKDQVFMDNAAGSYTARAVLDRLDHFYRAHKVQPYGVYAASQQAGAMMDESYQLMGEALNLHSDWVQFGPSSSQNTYVLAKAFSEFLQAGDAIIVTNQDHEANTGAWRKLAAHDIEVREWRVDPETGHLDIAKLDALLDEKVKLVAFPHASNIIGEINPADKICAMAKSVGAYSIVDGVSYAPHGLPDLADMGCDVYLFSTYKTYGPHLGVMAINPDLNRELPNQGHFFNAKKLRYRMTPAGPDHAQIGAVGGMVEYLRQVAQIAGSTHPSAAAAASHSAMRNQEILLMQPLLDYLNARNDVRLLGPSAAENRAPTISIVHEKPGIELATALAKHSIMTAGSHFYSYRLLEALNIEPAHGVLRLSFVHYTSEDDISRTISALDAVLGTN